MFLLLIANQKKKSKCNFAMTYSSFWSGNLCECKARIIEEYKIQYYMLILNRLNKYYIHTLYNLTILYSSTLYIYIY